MFERFCLPHVIFVYVRKLDQSEMQTKCKNH